MRLIDADKLKEKAFTWEAYEYATEDVFVIDAEEIDHAPSVDAPKEVICSVTVNIDTDEVIEWLKEAGWEPLEHGRWIPINDQVAKCSLCGMLETTHGKDKTGQALVHKAVKRYCSNCGAKMDEVSE